MERLTISDVEQELYAIYRWYAENAPGVIVQETGHVADLWALAHRLDPENYPDS